MATELMLAPGLGAGNFFRLAASVGNESTQSVIELDKDFRHPDGRIVRQLTLAELDALSDRVAAGFYRDGIRPKDPVAIFVEEGVRYLIHYMALTKIGAIPLFLNGRLSKEHAAKLVSHVGAVAIVSDGRLPRGTLDIPWYEADPYDDGPFRLFTHTDTDPVLIAHTSGTTGVPKAVQFDHAGFSFGVKQQVEADLGRRVLSVLPQSHASAISVLMSCVARGSRVLLATDHSAWRIARTVEEFRPELIAGFPRVFVDLCGLDLDTYDFGSVARWMSTGDANHERHIRKLVRLGNHRDRSGTMTRGSLFIDNFGSSEFGFAMFRQVHSPTTERYGRCVGRPFEWIEAQVFDDADEPAPIGTVGRLALKSPTSTAGYWNDSLRSEKNRVRGYWLTGDLAYRDEEGRFYHVDRTSDSISTPQGTIYSCQLEELILRRTPELSDCSLVGSQTDGSPRQLVLTVETPTAHPDVERLRARINSTLTEAGYPAVDQVVVKAAGEHVGLTGKALKRTMRDASLTRDTRSPGSPR